MKNKRYLHLTTQEGNKEHIDKTTKNFDFFDGIFAVVYNHPNGESDGTKALLEERKKGGNIESLNTYYGRHDLAMNINLQNPKINMGDWIFLLDTLEIINEDFYEEIPALLECFEENNIKTIAFEGKTFFFQRAYDQQFLYTPHWVLSNGHQQPQMDLKGMNNSEVIQTARINLRNDFRQPDHFIDHFVKYLWEFSDSNHGLMECENDKDRFMNFEVIRRQTRENAIQEGIPTKVEEFKQWIKDNDINDWPDFLKIFFAQDDAIAFRNFYRYHVLNHTIEDIKESQRSWELKIEQEDV